MGMIHREWQSLGLIEKDILTHLYSLSICPVHPCLKLQKQCDFRFDLFLVLVLAFQLFFSFSIVLGVFYRFSFSFAGKHKQPKNIKPADEDVLMVCLNTIHR